MARGKFFWENDNMPDASAGFGTLREYGYLIRKKLQKLHGVYFLLLLLLLS